MIKVIIADDHGIIRDSLKRMLNTYSDIEVVGCAKNGRQAYQITKRLKPDIVLMDAVMPESNGVEGTRLIKNEIEDVKIIMLTTFSDEHLILDAFEAGADGYVLKDVTSDQLVKVIKEAMQGSVVLSADVTKKLMGNMIKEKNRFQKKFNKTEEDIIKLMIRGYSNKEIASELNIGYGTVRNYVSSIYQQVDESERDKAIQALCKCFEPQKEVE